MSFTDKVRQMLRSFLNIQPAPNTAFSIQETLDFQANTFKNAVWFRGDSDELSQLYNQLPGKADSFWASVPSENHGLRKIHTGLPSIIVRVLADIVLADLNEPEIAPAEQENEWKEIAKENGFDRLLSQAVQKALYLGDGAFKINFEKELSKRPILEFYGADRVEYTQRHGRTVETRFYTELDHAGRKYQLCEAYGGGYIHYTLTDRITGNVIDMKAIPQTASLTDLDFDPSVCLAAPLRIFPSAKWEGRGKSVFEEKTDSFDALDEAWSQWMDALRTCRAKEYIPSCLIPRDPKNGTLLTPNRFDNRFIEVQAGMSEEGKQPEPKVIQPDIPHESYLATYITALDLCMQGLISPSTLGIDVKKLDNAEAQREKEKATLYTRGAIVDALRDSLPRVIRAALQAADLQANQTPRAVEVSVDFGEYANPSFEAQVETVGKAFTQGIMSTEAAVEELWGDAKDETWKLEEVARLKEAQGLVTAEEPFVGQEAIEGPEAESTGSTERLNGAQVSSLLSVVKMAKEGGLSRNEALSIAVSTLGISREAAESFIEDSMSAGEAR